MCQIFETFYLGFTSFVGLEQIVSIFHGNFSTILGLSLMSAVSSAGVQLSVARALGFAGPEEQLQGTTGECKPHFLSSEHEANQHKDLTSLPAL